MRLSDRVMEFVQEKLDNPETVREIRSKIIAPSLSLVKDELANSGYEKALLSMLRSVMWPVIAMIVAILLLTLLTFNLQVILTMRQWSVASVRETA